MTISWLRCRQSLLWTRSGGSSYLKQSTGWTTEVLMATERLAWHSWRKSRLAELAWRERRRMELY
jgi:hypothetical protein